MFLARIWVRVRKIIAWKEGKAVETVIDGLKIRYIDQGSGTPVLLLHGWGVEASVYHLIIDHLSARYRVVAPDLPGFGGSQEPDRPWDSTDFAAFVEKFAAAVQVRDPVLIGHSNGGRIILRLASRPEAALRAKKIVLIDSAGLPARHGPEYYLKVSAFKAGKAVLRLPGVRRLFPQAEEKWKARHGSSDYQKASEVMRRTMVRLLHEDLTDCLPKIQASTLLIWGDQDTATPLADAKIMEKQIPDAGLVVLEGTGHFSFAESGASAPGCWTSFCPDKERKPPMPA